MNRNFFVRLAFATHRVADTLPQEELIAEEIREAANTILADLIVFVDKEAVKAEKKRALPFQLKKQIDILLACLDGAKEEGWVNPKNFSLLKEEYTRIREFLEIFEDISFPGGVSQEVILDSEVAQTQDEAPRERSASRRREQDKGPKKDSVQTPNRDSETDLPLPVSRIPSRSVHGFDEKSKVQDKSILTSRQKRIIDFLGTKQNVQVWELQKVLPEVTKRTLRRDLDELLQKNLVERKGEWNAVAYELK